MSWQGAMKIGSMSYTCGYCGSEIASELGYFNREARRFIYICHKCQKPTYLALSNDEQVPGPLFGTSISSIPEVSMKDLYEEARRAFSARSYTLVVMAFRTLLMHIAVARGAQAGLYYTEYVRFLDENHYTPPDSKDWVDHIRDQGNTANHQIVIMEKE